MISVFSKSDQQDAFPVLKGPCLSQKPPEMIAEDFTQHTHTGVALAVQWKKKCNMPGPLYAFDAATVGNKIYAIGGRGKEERHDRYTYVYDAIKDSWEVKKEPMFPRSNHAVAALGNKIYVFGGNDSANKAEVYDVDADTWRELAPIPSPRMHINYSAAVCNDKIYLIGGLEKKRGIYYDTDSNKNEMYDPLRIPGQKKPRCRLPGNVRR
jgi:N-acetylneuraminic acid mutarotase